MPRRTKEPPSTENMLLPAQVAGRWNCSPRHVLRMISDGELLAINISTSSVAMWRIPLDEVLKAEKRRQT